MLYDHRVDSKVIGYLSTAMTVDDDNIFYSAIVMYLDGQWIFGLAELRKEWQIVIGLQFVFTRVDGIEETQNIVGTLDYSSVKISGKT